MAEYRSGEVPRLAVWKFASCDGCQLTLLSCEDELLTIADRVRIEYFLEASRPEDDATAGAGPYDLSLVEGSVSTPHDVSRIRRIREISGTLVEIGSCATAGGIQALRNGADIAEFTSLVYASPQYIETLAESRPVSDFVRVDFALPGCPIDPGQLMEVLAATVTGRAPVIPRHSVCHECKARGVTCVLVADGTPCFGPVTQAGCGALCPAVGRGCYGCFGPMESPNRPALERVLAAGSKESVGWQFADNRASADDSARGEEES